MAERGQASIELLAALPLLIVAGLVAGAMAVAADRPVAEAVEAALPRWAAERVQVDREGGRVSVTLRPPSPVDAFADRLAVTSSVWVRPPQDG